MERRRRLGSDSGGSIRIPAACCGVVCFKVSFGAVPIDGCWPLAPSYDTAGPMARDVAGCERMMAALPNATLAMFEESGHYPFVEEHERFTATVRDWISRLP